MKVREKKTREGKVREREREREKRTFIAMTVFLPVHHFGFMAFLTPGGERKVYLRAKKGKGKKKKSRKLCSGGRKKIVHKFL